MSAQSLLSSVFSCSSPAAAAPAAAKSLSKRRLRQTRSLDPAIIGGGREDGEGAGRAPRARAAGSPPGERRGPRGAPPPHGASFSMPSTPLERSPPGSALFDEESLRGKRSPGCELPFLARTPSALALSGPAGPANSIFSSPRRWLQQRKGQPSPPEPRPAAYVVWKSEVSEVPTAKDVGKLVAYGSSKKSVKSSPAVSVNHSSAARGRRGLARCFAPGLRDGTGRLGWSRRSRAVWGSGQRLPWDRPSRERSRPLLPSALREPRATPAGGLAGAAGPREAAERPRTRSHRRGGGAETTAPAAGREPPPPPAAGPLCRGAAGPRGGEGTAGGGVLAGEARRGAGARGCRAGAQRCRRTAGQCPAPPPPVRPSVPMGDSVFSERLALRYAGDFTWNSMSGRSVRLKSVPVQSLSELERARLQEVAFYQLQQDCDLGCQITIPKDGQKRKKSLRKKLDSLGKEKNRDKEFIPQAFGMPLSQVIANDRAYKLKQDSQREEQKDVSDFVAFLLPFGTKRQNKELSSSNSSLSSTSETPNESTSPNTPEPAPRARRRGAMSVDSITDLDDNQSRLLEALQLSLPAEAQSKKEKARDKKLSLNPIYRQVPRLVDSCCQHLEKHGLQTVGIFRVGSSKKRVRQLREEFDRGIDVVLDEEHSIHDVAALLKEFLRDMPDPLLTRELYTPFINTLLLEPDEQLSTLQLLIYLLPPCNCDTLHRLLQFLSTVAGHAEDTRDKDGQEITGNKMTSLNLATIFGPNLLHKQKSTDKEFSVQSSARAEESTAIIAVVQKMIENYEALFMVSPDLQNEVLISLLETDPDVVDYLLRRKASQSSSPEMLRSEGSYSTGERHSSTDSNKASSGDVSPYDNNSPVLSERSLMAMQEEVALSPDKLYKVPEQYTLVGHLQPKPKENSSASQAGKDVSEDHFDIWGTWHSTLKSGCKDPAMTGSYGNIYESSLLRPGQCSLSQGNLAMYSPRWQGSSSELDSGRQVMRRSQTTAAIPECQLHPVVSRVCSNPQIEVGNRSSDLSHSKSEQHLTLSSVEDLSERDSSMSCLQSTAKPSYRKERPPPPYPGPAKTSSALSQRSSVSSTLHSLWRLQRPEKSSGPRAAGEPQARAPAQATSRQERPSPRTQAGHICSTAPHSQNSTSVSEADWNEWQRERWQIWELLSADNPDALPETLV